MLQPQFKPTGSSVLFISERFSKDKPANHKLFPFSFEWCTEDAAKLHSSPFQKGMLAQKYREIQISFEKYRGKWHILKDLITNPRVTDE